MGPTHNHFILGFRWNLAVIHFLIVLILHAKLTFHLRDCNSHSLFWVVIVENNESQHENMKSLEFD